MKNWHDRLKIFLILFWIEGISFSVLPIFPDDFYFAVCIAFNSISIIAIKKFLEPSILSTDVVRLTIIQMSFQVIGGAIYALGKIYGWFDHGSPEFYNWSIRVIVPLTFLRLLIVGKNDGDIAFPTSRRLFNLGVLLGNKSAKRLCL